MQREVHHGEIHVKYIAPERWWQRAKWQLLIPLTSHNGNVTVPTGFITDGASIHWTMRWLFSPTGEYFCAAVIHDYILVRYKDWERANDEFENEINHVEMNEAMRWMMITAVRFWAKIGKLK